MNTASIEKRVMCPKCRRTLRAPASVAGKKVKCPHCSCVLLVPATFGQRTRNEAVANATYEARLLAAFREQVLFLKHNLNAAAIASLQGEVVAIERGVADLVAEMERAIAEADTFISNLSG